MDTSMLYDSDHFVVVQIGASPLIGFEIVDKQTNMGIFLVHDLALNFVGHIKAWQDNTPEREEVEAVLAGYTAVANNPLRMH